MLFFVLYRNFIEGLLLPPLPYCTYHSTSNLCALLLQFWTIDPLDVFGPAVEVGPNAFLSANPFYIIQSGQFNRVPWMCGLLTNEGIIRVAGLYCEADICTYGLLFIARIEVKTD